MGEYAHFGEWVKHRREALRLTQEELGQRLGYQEDTISRYEREDRFPKNSAEMLKSALEIPQPYFDDFLAVAKRTKPVDALPPAHMLSDAAPDERQRRNAVSEGSGKWVTHTSRDLLASERAERLIGRDRLIASVKGFLTAKKPVLVRGFGGIGKTALAAEIAYRQLVDAPQTSVMWLRVGEAGVRQAILDLARTLQLEREVSRSISNADAAELIQAKLAQATSLLLVLDDVWWSFEDFKWFIGMLVPPAAGLLITSRYLYALPNAERIELDQHNFELEDGGLPLLAHYASKSVDELKRDPVAHELCDFLGNLPLALEIAGQSMALGTSIQDLLGSVVKTLDNLQFPADYGESEIARRRHASVTATLNTSLDQLEDAHMRRVFFAFGAAFTPTISRDLLAGYLELSADRVQSALEGLSRRSLVRQIEKEEGIARYRVHDVAYRYLRERSAPNKAQQLRFIEACHRYVNDFAQNVNALYAERTNALHAASFAAETLHRPDILVDMLYRLTVDSAYLGAYGHDELLRQRLYDAIQAAESFEERQPEYVLMAHFLLSKLGNIEYLAGRLSEAQTAYEGALHRADSLEMRDREIILLGVLNRIFVDRKEFDVAGQVAEKLRQKSEALGNDYISMRALEAIGYYGGELVNFYKANGDPRYKDALAAAKQTWEKSYGLALKLEIPENQMIALINVAAVKHDFELYSDSVGDCEKGLEIARGNPEWRFFVAVLLNSMGMSHHFNGDRVEAQRTLTEARDLFKQLGTVTRFDAVTAFAHEHSYTIVD